jgi:hypothetical protein
MYFISKQHTFCITFVFHNKHIMNLDLALSKETCVTLAIKAFNKGQKKTLHTVAIALEALVAVTALLQWFTTAYSHPWKPPVKPQID